MKTAGWVAVAALIVLVAVVPDEQPEQPTGNVGGTVTDSTGDDRPFTAVACDENNRAFDVEPDTDAARAAAQAWCERSGAWLDTAPWPSGLRPIPLDDALNP